ncbi:MAG: hypothetical protein L6Q77_08865 [Bacteroidetes bacterium]|nr:hypothetical protein [Bacteroidota bacterium]
MKRLSWFIASLLLLAVFSGCGKEVKRATRLTLFTQGEKVPYTLKIEDYEKKYSGNDGVYLTYNYRIEADNFKKYSLRERSYVVLNPDNKGLTTFSLTLDEEDSLTALSFRTIKPDGTVRVFTKKDLIRTTDSEKNVTLKLAYPDITKGTIIEENFEYLADSYYQEVLFMKFQYDLPIELFNFKLIFKTDNPDGLKYKNTGTPKSLMNFYYDKNLKANIVEYTEKNIKSFQEDEPYTPYFKESGEFLEILYHSKIPSWSEFNRWLSDLSNGEYDSRSGRATDLALKLTEGTSDEEGKARILTEWVRDNIKTSKKDYELNYNAMLEDSAGDRIDKASLLGVLLKAVGIQSNFILVHDRDEGLADINFVARKEFSEPAIQIHLKEKEVVVFPGEKFLSFGFIPDIYQGQPAILIQREETYMEKKKREEENKNSVSAGGPKVVILPVAKETQNFIIEDYSVAISEEGLVTVSETKTLKGTIAYRFRKRNFDRKKEDIEKDLKDLLTYDQGELKITGHSIENLMNPDSVLRIKINYTIENLVTVTPEEVIFQTAGLLAPASQKSYLVKKDSRATPIRIYEDQVFVKNIRITTPENWTPVTELKKKKLSNRFGNFNSEIKLQKGEILVNQTRKLVRSSGIRQDYKDLIDITGSKSSVSIPNIIFKVD